MFSIRRETFWTAGALGVRAAGQLALTVAAVTCLSGAQASLWLVFASLGSLVQLFDLGLSSAVLRSASHFWAGVGTLKSEGIHTQTTKQPNMSGLRSLHGTMGSIYAALGLIIIAGGVLVGFFGFGPLLHGQHEWLAWGFFCVGTALQLMSSERYNLLQGAGGLIDAQKLSMLGMLLGLGLPASILALTGSLMLGCAAIALGWALQYFIFTAATRWVGQGKFSKELFFNVWPNTWRNGVSRLSLALMYHAPALIISRMVDIHLGGQYGLTVQVCLFIAALCQAPMTAISPKLHELAAAGQLAGVRDLFFSKIRRVMLLQLIFGTLLVTTGPMLMTLIGAKTQLLPLVLLLPLVVFFVFEHHRNNFVLLVSTFNHFPFWRFDLIAGLLAVAGCIVSLSFQSMVGVIIWLWVVQASANFWWPVHEGLKQLKSSWKEYQDAFWRGA